MTFKQILAGTNPLSTDVDQIRQAFSGIADVGPLSLCAVQSTPTAPNISAYSVGNLNGTYYYKVVFVTGFQQSDGSFYVNGFASSADSAQATIANGQGSLTNIPIGGPGTIGRAIYRTVAGGAMGLEKFAFVIWDNTTQSFYDNILDGNLGTNIPTSATVPAAYGTAIPSTPPATNTTGSTFNSPNYDASILKVSNTASLAANGWFKDQKTGLIIQWGVLTVAGGGGSRVTFPITFPSIMASVVPNNQVGVAVITNTITLSGFNIGGAGLANWIAVGY